MNRMMETNQRVIPKPEPEEASGKAESGGYTVHPAEAGPVSTKSETIMTALEAKKNQYDSIFRKGEAMSRAPSCNGISKLEKVPERPAVSTIKIRMVPCMVTAAK